jgi:hypothetical protein
MSNCQLPENNLQNTTNVQHNIMSLNTLTNCMFLFVFYLTSSFDSYLCIYYNNQSLPHNIVHIALIEIELTTSLVIGTIRSRPRHPPPTVNLYIIAIVFLPPRYNWTIGESGSANWITFTDCVFSKHQPNKENSRYVLHSVEPMS